MRKLTRKQELFVKEYLIDLNATAACIRAGYKPKWAGTNADKLLKNTSVASAIQKAMDNRTKKIEVNAEYVLNTILNTTNALIAGGKEKNAAQIYKGCELLGKHLKLFTDKIEHDHTISVNTVRKRFDGNSD